MGCSYQFIRKKGSLSFPRVFRENSGLPHLELGLPASSTLRHMSVLVSQPPHCWYRDRHVQKPLYAHTWV